MHGAVDDLHVGLVQVPQTIHNAKAAMLTQICPDVAV
jgi:hypothetical protein